MSTDAPAAAAGSRRALILDLDGTVFLPIESHGWGHISPRVSAAVRRAAAAGWFVLPATGRPYFGLTGPLAPLQHDGPMVVCNGAAALTGAGEVLIDQPLPADLALATARSLREMLPGVLFAAVRDAGRTFVAEDGYPALVTGHHDHQRRPDEIVTAALDELLSVPCTNLIVRHPTVGPRQLADLVATLPGVDPMYSNDDFLEVQVTGVSKATAVARICAAQGLGPEQAVAFGDSANDAAMLGWAGYAVAMGNATDAVKALADEIAPSNADDGVAVVVERLCSLASNPAELRAL